MSSLIVMSNLITFIKNKFKNIHKFTKKIIINLIVMNENVKIYWDWLLKAIWNVKLTMINKLSINLYVSNLFVGKFVANLYKGFKFVGNCYLHYLHIYFVYNHM